MSQACDLGSEDFTLTEIEKNKVLNVIDRSGQQCISTDVSFVDPTIKRYALSIILRYFDNIDKESIQSNIRLKLNDYFTKQLN